MAFPAGVLRSGHGGIRASVALRPACDDAIQGWLCQKKNSQPLLDELFFQRAVQIVSMGAATPQHYGMKEGSEKTFGKGYNVLPIFKKRLTPKR